MEGENFTQISEFLLLGLSDDPREDQLLFIVFLVMYLATVLGNLLIILAIVTDARLHTPMYFFLANLAFVDICFTTTTIPKMLVNHVTGNKTIPYTDCLTQMFFFILFASLDCYLLAAMAYDRYEAICNPLHYATSVTPQVCSLLVGASWTPSLGNSLIDVVLMNRLPFCDHNQIPNFFCELSSMMNLACSDTSINLIVNFESAFTIIIPFVGILLSYFLIFIAVLRIPSKKGKQKAFSTCGSHLSVVSLFYGTLVGVYFKPTSSHEAQKGTFSAVMYTVVTPMMNPFIYSLRNKDMKGALAGLVTRRPGLAS